MTGPQLQAEFDEEGAQHVFTGLAADIRRRQRSIARAQRFLLALEPFAALALVLLIAVLLNSVGSHVLAAQLEGRSPTVGMGPQADGIAIPVRGEEGTAAVDPAAAVNPQ